MRPDFGRAEPLTRPAGHGFLSLRNAVSQRRNHGRQPMNGTRLSIRIDLENGDRIGPGKITLLEAIRDTGSISAGARKIGMSYRRAWLLVEQINTAFEGPSVAAAMGGPNGGGAVLTPVGERVIDIYRSIEKAARKSASDEFRAVEKIIRKTKRKSK
jgi:molybdate transport system regulatory protein